MYAARHKNNEHGSHFVVFCWGSELADLSHTIQSFLSGHLGKHILHHINMAMQQKSEISFNLKFDSTTMLSGIVTRHVVKGVLSFTLTSQKQS